jgi:predicted dehydrogenase
VAEPDPARRARARATLGPDARLYPDLASLLAAERPAFVDVAAPPAFHAEAVEEAIAEGRHVLVEKPLAVTREQAEGALAAAQLRGVALVTIHNWHYAPAYRAARAAVEAGVVGRARRIEFVTERTEPAGGPSSWRLDRSLAGGGILMDHGWHQLYLARALLRAGEPTSVRAKVECRRWTQGSVEDTALAVVHFGADVEARLALSWAAPARRTLVTLEGDAGSLSIDGTRVRVRPKAAPERDWPVEVDAPDDSYHAAWFPPLLDLFASALASPASVFANRQEARFCQVVIDAAYRSAARGGEPIALAI